MKVSSWYYKKHIYLRHWNVLPNRYESEEEFHCLEWFISCQWVREPQPTIPFCDFISHSSSSCNGAEDYFFPPAKIVSSSRILSQGDTQLSPVMAKHREEVRGKYALHKTRIETRGSTVCRTSRWSDCDIMRSIWSNLNSIFHFEPFHFRSTDS